MRRIRNRLVLAAIAFSCAAVVLACGHRCYRYFCCPPQCYYYSTGSCTAEQPLQVKKPELLPMPQEVETVGTASLPGAWRLSDLTTGHSVLFPDTPFMPSTPIIIDYPPIITPPLFPVGLPPVHTPHVPPVELPPPSITTPVLPSIVLAGTGVALLLANGVYRRWRSRC